MRRPAFEQLANELVGEANALNSARWCGEALFAITRDGNESMFFDAWERGAYFLQARGLLSGEGGSSDSQPSVRAGPWITERSKNL